LVTLGYGNRQASACIDWKEGRKNLLVSDYLDDSTVLFLEVESRNQALETLISQLERDGKLKDVKRFRKAIFDRESIVSTGVGFGVAIPHAKLKEYPDFFIAIGIVQGTGLDWDALDAEPVNLIFLIGGPDNKQTQYLKILSELTSAIQNEQTRESLLRARSNQEVIALCSGGGFAWI